MLCSQGAHPREDGGLAAAGADTCMASILKRVASRHAKGSLGQQVHDLLIQVRRSCFATGPASRPAARSGSRELADRTGRCGGFRGGFTAKPDLHVDDIGDSLSNRLLRSIRSFRLAVQCFWL